MSGLHLSDRDRRAIIDGTDAVARKHRFRAPITPDGQILVDEPVDLSPDRESEADWADSVADRCHDHDPDARVLADELPPGCCPRWWGSGL